jgi:branched-chain amino acid transport system permease protein
LSRPLLFALLALALLASLPLFLSGNLLNAAIKMMIAALFALAFTLAMGQAGMLSFGHAAYYGLGAFAALHLMRAVEQQVIWFPTPLIPLGGAVIGFIFGLIFGWFATQRAGVYFAMVTLALAELLFTIAPNLSSIFGDESGISTIRGPSWGFTFGPDDQVYYLTLAWVTLCAVLMWAFTQTPLGRLALALRENEHRVRFLGFNTHVARTLIFAISCLFTGVAGSLLAIANEAANYTIFSAQASANVVLQTFIGGAGTFLGPALGAAVMTFFARVTSDLTRSWLLYQGLIFVFIMLFAPTGLGGLVAMHAQKVKAGGWRLLIVPYALAAVSGILLIAGLVFTIESIHVVLTDAYMAARRSAGGAWVPYKLFGSSFMPNDPATWAVPLVLFGVGGVLLPIARRIALQAWRRATTDPSGSAADPSASARKGEEARA